MAKLTKRREPPPSPISYDREHDGDVATFSDGVIIELRGARLDAYSRLMVEVVARMGDTKVHHSTINLLDQRARFDYHQIAARLDGTVDWRSHLLSTITLVQETIKARGAFGTSGTEASTTYEFFLTPPTPKPLPDPLPKVEAFTSGLLPEAVRPWIKDIAERMQCPPDFPAVAVMTSIASVLGRKVAIRPKKEDDWTVTPNLWGGVVGRPGVLKTPAILEPLRQVHRLQYDAEVTYKASMDEWKVNVIVAKEQEKVGAQQIRDALKKQGNARAIAESLVASEQQQPTRKRYIVNDSTVEKMGELLNENPNGLLIFRDELTGLLKQLDREGHESDRAFYLEAWNGNGRFTYDRIARGTIDIEAACVSILGGIQPGPLGHYLRSALHGGEGDDGLMQRFQLLVWPDIDTEWVNVDRWPDSEAKQVAYHMFTRLDALAWSDIDAVSDEQEGQRPYLRFSVEAQEAFDTWRSALEHRLRAGREHPAIEAHLAKYRSLVPSLALIIHLADGGKNPVGVDALARACTWAEYLESHAHRVYSQGIAPDDMAARELAVRIQSGDVVKEFTAREVYRHHWAGLATLDDVDKAIEVLIDLDWLHEVKTSTGGRPSTKYLINPRVEEVSL